MSTAYISAEIRRQVIERAKHICEYCLIHEDDTFFGCHIDHIISEKHGGLTEISNLAYACTFCNLHKGSDIASLDSEKVLTPFFNPRTDNWSDHFILAGAMIKSSTRIGEVTANIFQFNTNDRLIERQILLEVGRYPGIQGVTPIMPDLTRRGWDLTYDQQVKILSYIVKHFSRFADLPSGLKVRVFAVEWIGGPWPALCLYSDRDVRVNVDQVPDPASLEAKLNNYFAKSGKDTLLKLSADETLCWQDVLGSR